MIYDNPKNGFQTVLRGFKQLKVNATRIKCQNKKIKVFDERFQKHSPLTFSILAIKADYDDIMEKQL